MSCGETLRKRLPSSLLAAKAREDRVIDRLRGGDPFLFAHDDTAALFRHEPVCPFHARPRDCDGVCVVDYVREQILPYLMAPDRIAGVMIEPVAGEAGVFIPPDPFWPALMELCREHGWLWCADEAQTLSREGTL